MKTDSYLYGEYETIDIPEEVILRKVESLNFHLEDLLEDDMLERDNLRCKEVKDAIEFWLSINDKDKK